MLQPQTSMHDAAFKRGVDVVIEIDAEPETVWALLTDAAGFKHWNSTVSSIDGKIAMGERLTIHTSAAARPLEIRVTEFDPPGRMTWRSGSAKTLLCVRTFKLASLRWRRTRFTMSETISGPDVVGADIQDLVPLFARYAEDLKQAAEGAAAARVA